MPAVRLLRSRMGAFLYREMYNGDQETDKEGQFDDKLVLMVYVKLGHLVYNRYIYLQFNLFCGY